MSNITDKLKTKFEEQEKAKIEAKRYSIKALKFHDGHDGQGFNLNLYYDNKKIGTVYDGAYGGDFEYHLDAGCEDKLIKLVASLPDFAYDGGFMSYNSDIFIDDIVSIVSDAQDAKRESNRLKRACKTKTLLILKRHTKKGEYCEIKHPYNDKMKEHLKNKYKDTLVEIINERYL